MAERTHPQEKSFYFKSWPRRVL